MMRLALLLVAAPALGQTPDPVVPRVMRADAVAAMPQPAPTEVLRYGEAEAQVIEVYAPDAAKFPGPRPAVALLHGGCWRKDVAGRELVRPAAADLASRGYAVWSIGYRRIDEPGGGYPGTYEDVTAALDLMTKEAAARGVDAGRVAFMGHSAGAHLALWAASRRKIEGPLKRADALRPRVVMSLGGLADLKNYAGAVDNVCGADTVAGLTGVKSDARPDVFADTSPYEVLPVGVPVVMVQGIYDHVSYPALGRSYAFRAQARGDRAQVALIPNAGHFEVIAPGTPAWNTIVTILAARVAPEKGGR
jgi:acetyl esterase/lipase